MPSQDWMYRVSAPMLVAGAKAGLTGAKKDQINGLAWLKAKHEELLNLDPTQGSKEFQKLDRNAQSALKQIYGDTTYAPEEKSLGGRIWDIATKPVDILFSAFTSYNEAISTPFRAIAGEGNLGAFFDSKMWEKYSDGKRIFDAEREAIVDRAYAPEIAKIAKRMSIGDSFGQIIQNLSTDAEFAAMEKFLSGSDQTAKNALRDYNDAKLSWGRSFAHMLGIEPKVGVTNQGITGKAYQWVSGAADLIGDVAFDPLTYVGMPLKAINTARFGLVNLMSRELTMTQKTLQAVTMGTMKFGVEAAFEVKSVRQAFDQAGPLIAEVRKNGADSPAAARAMEEVQRLHPFFDPLTVTELSKYGKEGVKDADTAVEFFKDSDKLSSILLGRSGEMTRMLPQYNVIRAAKQDLGKFARKVSGYDRAVERVAVSSVDDAMRQLQSGATAAEQLQLEEIGTGLSRTRFWVNRAASRSMTEGYIYMDGIEEATGRSMHLKSVDTIYNLSRSFMDRYHARLVANLFAVSKNASERRKIVSGVFETMADRVGVPKSGPVREEFNKEMDKWRNAVFSEEGAVSPGLIDSGLFPEGTLTHNPGIVDGIPQAVADHHLQNAAAIPNFHEIMDIFNKGMRVRSVSNTVNNSFVSALTDFWSALNLLPRLGIRSAVDENLFHIMTMPVVVMKDVLKGYQTSIGRRIVKKDGKYTRISGVDAVSKAYNAYKKTGSVPTALETAARQELWGQRDIGVLARVMKKFIVDLTPEEQKAARASDLAAASLLKRELTRGRFNWSKLSPDEAKYVEDLVRFGHVNEIDNLTSGFNAGVSGGVPLGRAQQAMIYDLNPHVVDVLKEKNFEFGRIFSLVYKHDIEYTANYMIQLSNRIDRNGIIGKIAAEHIDDPALAVDKIVEFLSTKEGDALFRRYERAQVQDVRQFAIDRYMHVRNVLVGDDGELIPELVDLVRKKRDDGTSLISAADIRPEDLSDLVDKLPTRIMGYKAKSTSKKNLANWLEMFFDEGFRVADRQVATLSREPATYAYNLFYRKRFADAEKRHVQKLLADNPQMSPTVAELIAARKYSFISNEMALNRVGGFIDNPNVRSNFAYSMRNLARYYRATEDFWRRVRRATSPESIVRLRMASEGLDNAGFIHEDDQGEKYFVMPVDEIMYQVYSPIVEVLTGEKPKQMMPVKFTGKIKMLTPSLDPESALPTFSSPFMSVAVSLLAPILPEEYADDATRTLLGSKAEGQTLADALAPSILRRTWQVVSSSTGGMNEQIHSAAMKSIAFYAANGMAPGSDAKPAEREQFIRDVKATARNIVAVRNLLGIFSPVSPGMADIQGIPSDILDQGFTSFKAEFNELVGAEFAAGNADAFNSALSKWTKLYPGRLVYTVSETQMNTVGAVKKTKQAQAWVQENRPLVDKYRQASVFLMPQNAGFDWDAYAFMKREGYLESKTLEKFMEDVANVADENAYFDIADKYDTMMANSVSSGNVSNIRLQKETEQRAFLEARPYLKLKLEKSQAERPVELKRQTLQEMRELISSGKGSGPALDTIRQMINEFDRVNLVIGNIVGQTDGEIAARKSIRNDAAARIQDIAGINPNALAFYNAILKRLLNQ